MFLILPASSKLRPFTRSVRYELDAMALPHPKVLNLTSEMIPLESAVKAAFSQHSNLKGGQRGSNVLGVHTNLKLHDISASIERKKKDSEGRSTEGGTGGYQIKIIEIELTQERQRDRSQRQYRPWAMNQPGSHPHKQPSSSRSRPGVAYIARLLVVVNDLFMVPSRLCCHDARS